MPESTNDDAKTQGQRDKDVKRSLRSLLKPTQESSKGEAEDCGCHRCQSKSSDKLFSGLFERAAIPCRALVGAVYARQPHYYAILFDQVFLDV